MAKPKDSKIILDLCGGTGAWSKYRWMQWPRWELPTLADGFGWITQADVQEAAELLTLLEEQEDEFCPACDAGAGHCNGPHKGSDEIGF